MGRKNLCQAVANATGRWGGPSFPARGPPPAIAQQLTRRMRCPKRRHAERRTDRRWLNPNVAERQLVGPVERHPSGTACSHALNTNPSARGSPELLFGDLNDRRMAFCALGRAGLHAAAGGSGRAACRPRAHAGIDRILGRHVQPVGGLAETIAQAFGEQGPVLVAAACPSTTPATRPTSPSPDSTPSTAPDTSAARGGRPSPSS